MPPVLIQNFIPDLLHLSEGRNRRVRKSDLIDIFHQGAREVDPEQVYLAGAQHITDRFFRDTRSESLDKYIRALPKNVQDVARLWRTEEGIALPRGQEWFQLYMELVLQSQSNPLSTSDYFAAGSVGSVTWNKAAAANDRRFLHIVLIGGGGSSGSGARTTTSANYASGGSAGGGAALLHGVLPYSMIAATAAIVSAVSVTGGAAISAADSNGNDGQNGNNTSFNDGTIVLTAQGGSKGEGGTYGATQQSRNGGAGGRATATGIPAPDVLTTQMTLVAGQNGGNGRSGATAGGNGAASTAGEGASGGGGGGAQDGGSQAAGGDGGQGWNGSKVTGATAAVGGTAGGGVGGSGAYTTGVIGGGGGGGGSNASNTAAGNGGSTNLAGANGASPGGGGGRARSTATTTGNSGAGQTAGGGFMFIAAI